MLFYQEREGTSHSERFGHTMKRAGVAITITSVTDMVAFGIGSLTEVPALKSFCTYACVGIFAIFLFQSTVFVAAMSLDQKVQYKSLSILNVLDKPKKNGQILSQSGCASHFSIYLLTSIYGSL